MFSKETYVGRRAQLKKLVKSGIILLPGNNESPCNYPNNAYYPFRQDSSFLYYFGQNESGLVGLIDVGNDTETIFGNDIDIEDIVSYGSVDKVADMAAQVGVRAPAGTTGPHKPASAFAGAREWVCWSNWCVYTCGWWWCARRSIELSLVHTSLLI